MNQNISAYLQEEEAKRWDMKTASGLNPDDMD